LLGWLALGLLLLCCRSTEANKYTQQELLLMKTQDAKYLGLKSRTEAAVSSDSARLGAHIICDICDACSSLLQRALCKMCASQVSAVAVVAGSDYCLVWQSQHALLQTPPVSCTTIVSIGVHLAICCV
jgi:hypothetical protein